MHGGPASLVPVPIERVVRRLIAMRLLALGQFDLPLRQVLYGICCSRCVMVLSRARLLLSEWTTNQGGPGRVGGLEHLVAGARVIVPAAVGFQVHWRQFPDL